MACRNYVHPTPKCVTMRPRHIDIKKDEGLTITWEDGSTSFYSVAYLRKHSPSADARALREEMARNPLTVLPTSTGSSSGPLRIEEAHPVGNYAISLTFSDGHNTGIYSWRYLAEIAPQDKK